MQNSSALWSTSTADELHRVVVLHQPIRTSADAHQLFALLQRHHETEPAASIVTALLLLTDRRWRGGVGPLAHMIASSGILAPDELDLLAQTFLAAGDAVYWAIPDEWFSDGVVIVLADEIAEGTEARDDAHDGERDVEAGAVARREVSPPLRRWAAAWLVRRDASTWSSALARSNELDSRGAAAIISGLLDAREALEPKAPGVARPEGDPIG